MVSRQIPFTIPLYGFRLHKPPKRVDLFIRFLACVLLITSFNIAAQSLPNSTVTAPSSPLPSDEPAHCDNSNTDGCSGNATDVGSSSGSLLPRSGVGNPIDLMSGNKFQSEADFSVSGSQLMFNRMYNSMASDSNVGVGMGWRHSYAVSIADSGNGTREITQSDGTKIHFSTDGSEDESENEKVLRAGQSHYGFLVQKDNLHLWYLPDGRTLKFEGSFLVQISWADQRTLKLYYRSQRLESVTDETGRVLVFAYTAGNNSALADYEASRFGAVPGMLESITLPDGSQVGYDYDQKMNLSRVRFADGTSREYHYENETYPNHLTGLTDRTGVRFSSWTYDDYGRGISSELAGGIEKVTLVHPEIEKVDNGEVVKTVITNSLGAKSTYKWKKLLKENRIRLLSSEGAGCASCPPTGITYAYDEQGRLLSATKNQQGNAVGVGSTSYRYDEVGRVTEVRETDASGVDRLVQRRAYEHLSLVPSRIYQPSVNPDQERVTEIERDEQGLPIRITERAWAPWVPLPSESDFVDKANVVAEYRSIERTTKLRYEQGRLVEIDGPRIDIEDITKLTWDNNNRLIAVARPLSPIKRFSQFDSFGRPTKLQIGQADSYYIVYSGTGDISQIKHRGRVVSFEYDAEGRMTSYTDYQGRVTVVTRDAIGRKISVKDAFGRRSTIDLDSENRQTTLSAFGFDGSLIRSIAQSFSIDGHQQSHTDTQVNAHGESDAQTFIYAQNADLMLSSIEHEQTGMMFDIVIDHLNKSLAVTSLDANKTTSYVDRIGQEAGRTDYRSNTTKHIRDDFGRRVGTLSPDTGIERLERNSAGNIVRRVREDSGTTHYVYDEAGRVLTRTHANGDLTRYQYDNESGKLIYISNSASTEQFGYSKNGEMLVHSREIDNRKFITSYAYDEIGRLKSKELPDGQVLLYSYHESGPNSGYVKEIAKQGWFGKRDTLVGKIDLEKRDGAMGWQSHNGLKTTFAYAPNGQLLSTRTAGIQSLRYEYDTNLNVVGIEKNGVKSTYQYKHGKLFAAVSANQSHYYEYDVQGNRRAQFINSHVTGSRTGTEYLYSSEGAGNRLLSTRDLVSGLPKEWAYSAGGAPLKANDFNYRYDNERRPIELKQGSKIIAKYQYNGFGERVSKTTYHPDLKPVTTYFLYDSAVMSAEVESTSDKLVQYIYLDRHRPVLQLNGEVAYAIHTDKLGTPVAMSDKSATPVWAANYSPFGEATVTINTGELNLRLPGQYADAETGTHYNYFRDYDPAIGRYLTSDPIGLVGGDNTYAYALLNPLSNTDVFGLFSSNDSLTPEQMQALSGDPVAIKAFVESELNTFEDRHNFYQWAHETLNSPESARKADWFLAASHVNSEDSLGALDDFLPNAVDVVEDETVDYIKNVGLGLAELNVQTFLSLYFGDSIAGIDPVAPPGTCGLLLQGTELDLKLVEYEQRKLSQLTDAYFNENPDSWKPWIGEGGMRDWVMNDINDLLNFQGATGIGVDFFGQGDANTIEIVRHFWPDGDFDYTLESDRIKLGQAVVKLNNGEDWR